MGIEYDPFTTHLGDNPYPLYRELREQGPVHFSKSSEIYCVTRYDEVRSVLAQPEVFSSRAMETVFAKGRNYDFKMRHVIDGMRFLWKMRSSLLVAGPMGVPARWHQTTVRHEIRVGECLARGRVSGPWSR